MFLATRCSRPVLSLKTHYVVSRPRFCFGRIMLPDLSSPGCSWTFSLIICHTKSFSFPRYRPFKVLADRPLGPDVPDCLCGSKITFGPISAAILLRSLNASGFGFPRVFLDFFSHNMPYKKFLVSEISPLQGSGGSWVVLFDLA